MIYLEAGPVQRVQAQAVSERGHVRFAFTTTVKLVLPAQAFSSGTIVTSLHACWCLMTELSPSKSEGPCRL